MTPDYLDPNHIEYADIKKLEALKKAVSEGTYTVSAEDLTPKILEFAWQPDTETWVPVSWHTIGNWRPPRSIVLSTH
jgi:Anti-sigma-28 factor, FlgM